MKIEIWSDFVCPFCYIGIRNLHTAIAAFPNRDKIKIEYRSYQLDPTAAYIPGKDFNETLSELKDIPLEKIQARNKQVTKQAQDIGLDFNFAEMKYANTFDAHRLLQYAITKGKGAELTATFMHAYFTEGALLSDEATLLRLTSEIDLGAEEVKDILNCDRLKHKVAEDIAIAKEIGVQGVPFYVFNEKYGLSGAESSEIFSEVLEKVWEEEEREPVHHTAGEAKTSYCTGEGCEES